MAVNSIGPTVSEGVAPISVIIPVYNGAQFLERTIATIYAQSLKPAEIIVVDDGSVDNSAAVAEACGVTVIRRENGGISAARNTGVLAASQPWIALLDHDDAWAPNKLAQQWSAVQAFPGAALISTDCEVVNGDGDRTYPSFAGRDIVHYDRLTVTRRSGGANLHEQAFDELALCGWFLLPSAAMVRRDVLMAAGAFDERLRRLEDTSCFLRVLKYGSLVFIDEPLTKWVVHTTNSHRDVVAMLRGYLHLHEIMRAEPEKYPISYRKRMDRERPARLLMLARAELEAGLPDASAHAREALRLAPSLRALTLSALASLPVSIQTLSMRLSRYFRA